MPAGDWIYDITVQTTKQLTTTGGKGTVKSTAIASSSYARSRQPAKQTLVGPFAGTVWNAARRCAAFLESEASCIGLDRPGVRVSLPKCTTAAAAAAAAAATAAGAAVAASGTANSPSSMCWYGSTEVPSATLSMSCSLAVTVVGLQLHLSQCVPF
jgi:hypothetical protein